MTPYVTSQVDLVEDIGVDLDMENSEKVYSMYRDTILMVQVIIPIMV
nr:MAG TPA: hypothetical protein [Caudoviricetes sp.]